MKKKCEQKMSSGNVPTKVTKNSVKTLKDMCILKLLDEVGYPNSQLEIRKYENYFLRQGLPTELVDEILAQIF